MTHLMEIQDLAVYYGKIQALKGISLHIAEGEIVTLIGSNGAGKSTTLRAISGMVAASQGSVSFEGRSLKGLRLDQITAAGIVQVPEGRKIFSRLSVLENLEMGAYLRRDKAGIQADLKKSYEWFPVLFERRQQKAGTLSGGEQQMLAIARAMMTRPRLLLLDEPSMGLAPLIVKQIMAMIQRINQEGLPIFLVEQNAVQALQIAHRGYVLETGHIRLSGPAQDLLNEPQVRQAYLGG